MSAPRRLKTKKMPVARCCAAHFTHLFFEQSDIDCKSPSAQLREDWLTGSAVPIVDSDFSRTIEHILRTCDHRPPASALLRWQALNVENGNGLNGGVGSLRRDSLGVKFPANREIYSEFMRFFGPFREKKSPNSLYRRRIQALHPWISKKITGN